MLLLLLIVGQPRLARCEAPLPAGAIADSVGVNIHLHFGNTIYGNFPLIESLLVELGVRHTRDGLIDTTWQEYYQRHTALGKLGIRCIFITPPTASNALLIDYPNRVPGAFEGYEAPNEYNQSGDPNWAATLKAFIPRLYSAVKSNRATAQYFVIGPSLTQPSAYQQVAGLQSYFDLSNMHNYFGGRNPGTTGWGSNGYGSISWNVNLVQSAWPGRIVVATETGYISDLHIAQSIPEDIEGRYVPRAVFEQVLHGVARTYFYELIDEGQAIAGSTGAFGLARIDGSRKPAFIALKNLLAMLSDSAGSLPLQNLDYSLSGASINVHHLLLGKRDGSLYLAFWLEEPSFDQNTRTRLNVPAENVTFTSSQVFRTMQLSIFGPDGSIRTTSLTPFSRIPLTVTDTVSILRLM